MSIGLPSVLPAVLDRLLEALLLDRDLALLLGATVTDLLQLVVAPLPADAAVLERPSGALCGSFLVRFP